MWMVIYFVIDTHQPSPLPAVRHLSLEDARIIAHDPENWKHGVYGVIRKE